jgi:hypothetical protein
MISAAATVRASAMAKAPVWAAKKFATVDETCLALG